MSGEWFEKWFSSKYYLELYSHRDEEDARWIINLLQRNINLPTGSRVLDIACGAGRHSIELARRGFNVLGFDLSKYLIRTAEKNLRNSKERGLKLRFQIRDMRNFNYHGKFDIALNIFSSFGYFDSDESNFSVFKNASSSLRTGGYFVFDFINKEYLLKNLIPESVAKKGNYVITQRRAITGDYVEKKILISEGKRKASFDEKLKLYPSSVIKKALSDSGLKVTKTFGDYFGNKFIKHESQRYIVFAEKI